MKGSRSRRVRTAWLVAAAVLTSPAQARADGSDPWFGRDKALHFGASATLAAGGYTVGAFAFDARYEALLLGAGVGLGAGAGKEAYDAMGYGDPSWRDFVWDVVGTAVGVSVAWGLDLALRGTTPGVRATVPW